LKSGKVLLVELNEVTWDLIDPLIERGKLPTFARLKREGVWAAPVSVDMPPHLDPWIARGERSFTLTKLKCGGVRLGRNEFVFVKEGRDKREVRQW